MVTTVKDTGVTKSSLAKCFADGSSAAPVRLVVSGLKVSGVETRRLTGAVSDFETTVGCAFASRLLAQHDSGVLTDGAVIEVKNFQCSDVEGVKKIMILDGEVMCKYTGDDLPKLPAQTTDSVASSKSLANVPPVSPSEMPVTPAPAASNFEFKTPTTAMATPPMAFATSEGTISPPQTGEIPHQPIQSLNPYKSKFTIKAKIDSMQPLKNAVIKGESVSIKSVVLVDTEGSQIEGTFWREMADEMEKMLKVGSVYFISNGQLSGANRRYSTTGNDYKINFNQKTTVKAAIDQDASKMNAKCHFVKIDCLQSKIAQKLPVDIVGVVTDVGSLGSIKRKQDDTEFVRRDITLVDDSRKSVVVTLWREQAERLGGQLEQLQNPVLVMTKMRVGDYNGVSVSGTYSSHFIVDPTGYPEAVALQQWWESEGSTQTFSPAGDSASRAGLKRLSKWQPIESMVPADKELSVDDPPVYASLTCVLTQIPEDQTLYYQANPANNKKVEANGTGKYVEVGSGEVVDDMVRRYILNARVMDFTNSTFVNVFNEQAEDMLKMRADELNTIKGLANIWSASVQEDADKELSAYLEKPAWSVWTLDVLAKPREYNGKTKMRVNVRTAQRLDYATDSARLISSIVELGPNEFPQLQQAVA